MSIRVLPSYTFLTAVAATLAIGCGNSDDSESQAITMAFIPKTSNNPVFMLGNEGAQFAARDLTAASGRDVTVSYLASDELTLEAEEAHVREAISSQVDGMIVSCIEEALTPVIDEAIAAGIPTITYDSDCPNSGRLAFYSMDSEASGAKGADLLAAALGTGPKTIAVLTGRAGADNLERRVNGFAAQLAAQHPDISVVTTVNCMETAESCGPAIEDEIIAAYPDLDGLFVVGLWGLQAACTCDASGLVCTCEDTQMPNWKAAASAGLKTVSYDTLPFELILMQQGYVSALLGQKCFGWGYDTVNLMFDHVVSGREVSGFLDSGFDVVCPNNVQDMDAKWQAKDFRAELAPACDLVAP
jgi:ribose transport system substrate-binding protein